MRRRTLPPSVFLALLLPLAAPAASAVAEEAGPPGWTTTVQRSAGSERRLWTLTLVTQESSRHVTLVVAPVSQAGKEGTGAHGEQIERSESGDLHQIALWADNLRKEAQGWKRPSLRDRPPASAHVIGVIRSVVGPTTVENAEHGGGNLMVGDLLFVEDVFACSPGGTVGVDLLGPEDRWHHRWSRAEIRCARGARVGLRGTSDALHVHLHQGDLLATAWTAGLRLRTERATYAPAESTTCLLTARASGRVEGREPVPPAERVDVRTGLVVVQGAGAEASVAGGTSLALDDAGTHEVTPLDDARWDAVAPQAPTCTREEALRLVGRVAGHWRGQPRNASITLGDDGRWRSYERHTGRSVNKGGAWEPRPGGLLELTYVFTPHRSKTPKTDVFRYLLDGDALVRLRPGGQVFLQDEPQD